MKKRILVVEDEQSLRQMIAFNLEAEGYEVVALGDGKKAIEIMPGINRFSLVVLDLSSWDDVTGNA